MTLQGRAIAKARARICMVTDQSFRATGRRLGKMAHISIYILNAVRSLEFETDKNQRARTGGTVHDDSSRGAA